MTTWTLKTGIEKKFASGHPWVFSNDLAHSPKGVTAGEPVELRDSAGRFLARGYGHPNTLISFRVLTRDAGEDLGPDFWLGRLRTASHLRRLSGVFDWSHRLCFAEGDGIPGLIIDRYRLAPSVSGGGAAQVFVVQSSTAGIDRFLDAIFAALQGLVEFEAGPGQPSWETTGLVIANDSKSRNLEGIPLEPKKVLKAIDGLNPVQAPVLVQPPLVNLKPAVFTIDLIGGQKTGFFLDQRVNVRAVAEATEARLQLEPRPLRILDLCCYVGQWGTQLAHVGSAFGRSFEVTLVDASQHALDQAVANVEAHGGKAIALKLDILADLGRIGNRYFDIVICDPPAFIKKKKDAPTGEAAYVKLNREAMKKVAYGGLFFSSSCSGLLSDEDFRRVLGRAAAVHTDRMIRWTWRGSHGPDHPQRPEFIQGTYLKSWMAHFMN